MRNLIQFKLTADEYKRRRAAYKKRRPPRKEASRRSSKKENREALVQIKLTSVELEGNLTRKKLKKKKVEPGHYSRNYKRIFS